MALTQSQRIRYDMAAYQVTQEDLIEELGWKYKEVLVEHNAGRFTFSEDSEKGIMQAIRTAAERKNKKG
jgi:hypothetical protein